MNQIQTLLVNLPISSYIANKEYKVPPSVLYLAAYLKHAGEEVTVLDLNIYKPWEKNCDHPEDECFEILLSAIEETKPQLIGFGCIFSGFFPIVWKFSSFVKERFPGIKIVTGGMHPTIFAKEILQHCPVIDYIVIGEGEKQLLELVTCLKNDIPDVSTIENGFAYKNGEQVIVKQQLTFIDHLDDIPFPAYELVDFSKYEFDTSRWVNPKKLKFKVSVPIISSRSCPNQCNFCSMFLVMGKKFRYRSAKNVVDEIELLYRENGINHFNFMDDNFTFMKQRTLDICNEIVRRNLNIQFETLGGLMGSKIDQDIVDALAGAGWVRGAIAIESGSDYIRNIVMGKKLTREKIFEIIELVRKYPYIYLRAAFIIGMPEDTHETLMDTYNMLEKLDIDQVFANNVVPFPGTKLYEQCVRDDLMIDVNISELWNESSLYSHQDNKRFFVKPYKLSLEDLQHYRQMFDGIEDRINNRKRV
jgi:radical SAM superfamily enzyme YgiQ (UPF0313 family)